MDLVASYDSGDSENNEDTPSRFGVVNSAKQFKIMSVNDNDGKIQKSFAENIIAIQNKRLIKVEAIEKEVITIDDSDEEKNMCGIQRTNTNVNCCAGIPSTKPENCKKKSEETPEVRTASVCSSSSVNVDFKSDINKSEVHNNGNETEISDTDEFDDKYEMYREDFRLIKARETENCIPKKIKRKYAAHTDIINTISWCIPRYSHLLLSASEDATLKIWDIYCRNPVQYIKCDTGLKAAKWAADGQVVFTGGYGKKVYVYDVLSGLPLIAYDVRSCITSISIYPEMEDVFLCGAKRMILGYDLRVNADLPVRTFFTDCEQVLDILFLEGNSFVCSNVVNRNFPYRTIMAWDFGSGSILAEQIYMEQCTVPSLKVNPFDSSFVAQTSDDCIVSFSMQRPYIMNTEKYIGHKVSGLEIECDISPDGEFLASGDANGDVFYYDYKTADIIHKTSRKSKVTTSKLKWNPVLPSTVATATWDGELQIWR